jgi:hypothetical protein
MSTMSQHARESLGKRRYVKCIAQH